MEQAIAAFAARRNALAEHQPGPPERQGLRRAPRRVMEMNARRRLAEAVLDAWVEVDERPVGGQELGEGLEADAAGSGGLVAQISSLETQGVKALLDKDLMRSSNQFAAAYRLWPVYRTTDEIQRYLRSRAANPPTNDARGAKVMRCHGAPLTSHTAIRMAAATNAQTPGYATQRQRIHHGEVIRALFGDQQCP